MAMQDDTSSRKWTSQVKVRGHIFLAGVIVTDEVFYKTDKYLADDKSPSIAHTF